MKICVPLVAALVIAMPTSLSAFEMSITPRYSIYYDNTTQRQSGISVENYGSDSAEEIEQVRELMRDVFGPSAQYTIGLTDTAATANQARHELFGATLGFNWPGSDSTQVAITALTGKSKTSTRSLFRGVSTFSVDAFAASDVLEGRATGDVSTRRLDLEATLQHRLNETFSIVGGLRYERVSIHTGMILTVTQSGNIANMMAYLNDGFVDFNFSENSTTGESSATSNLFSLRLGAAAYAAVSARQSFYVNGLLHLSHSLAETGTETSPPGPFSSEPKVVHRRYPAETAIGPDVSVGYIFRLGDRFAVDARYRVVAYFTTHGTGDFNDPRVNHGVLVGATLWIN